MQLHMTAPLDIGLEQADAVLGHGQEDIFDLENAGRTLRKKASFSLVDTDDEDEEPESKDDHSSNNEALDTDGEQNGRMQALENELDELYETYRERLAERDAKFKVREARQNDRRREEWLGVDRVEPQTNIDAGDEGGGWHEMEQRKAKDDESDSSSTDEEGAPLSPQLSKRKQLHQQETSRKKTRLLTSLEEPQTASQVSRKANVWFSQDVFAGLDQLSESDREVDNTSQPLLDVEVRFSFTKGLMLIHYQASISEDDGSESQTDFEVVPQELDDAEMWDVNDPNEDELTTSQIKRTIFVNMGSRGRLIK